MTAHYVQYGCGFSAPPGWINFDASPTLRYQRIPLVGRLYHKNAKRFPSNIRYGDIVRGLPLPNESCKGIYASHVLEHLSRSDFDRALSETWRLLQPSGLFRLVVPDLEALARRYIKNIDAEIPNTCDEFMRHTSLGRETRPHSLRAFFTEWFGNSRHLWMWDYGGIAERLSAHNFTAIRRAHFQDSDDRRFLEVEEQDRFADAVAVEALRPE